ncbi:MAG: hypothetical protein WDN49_20975 [Acetobacteraceae bacterium]
MPLATDRVRYVGEPIAIVVAETAKQAKDAAEAVFPHHRSPARRHHRPRRRRARCPAALRRSARQHPAGLPLRRHRSPSPPPSPAPRMSPGWTSATAASSSARWSRAPPSARSIPTPTATCCGSAARACSACATC